MRYYLTAFVSSQHRDTNAIAAPQITHLLMLYHLEAAQNDLVAEARQVFKPACLKGHVFRSLGAYRLSEQQHGELPNPLLSVSICTPSKEKGC